MGEAGIRVGTSSRKLRATVSAAPTGCPAPSDGEAALMAVEWDPRKDDEYDDFLRGERLVQAARVDAKRLEAAQAWTPPAYPVSAYEQLAEQPPEVGWIFRDLWSGIAQVNAQKKSGKTTLLLNAAASLVTGEPFLRRFEVNVDTDCRVGYLNMELTKGQFNRWLADMALPDDALKRLHLYHGREYGRLDLTNDAAAEWIIQWLRDAGITVLLMDPLGSFYDQPSGGDPNAAYLRWWARLEHVVLQAELCGVLIAHHAGYSEDGGNRARGASAMMDKPDVNMTYRYEIGVGNHTDAPSDNKRYLSAFGRDVDVSEFEIGYNLRTRTLRATGGGSRAASAIDRYALKAYDTVVSYTNQQKQHGSDGPIELNAGELSEKAGIAQTSKLSGKFRQGRDLAVQKGWLEVRKQGNSTLYSLGEAVPLDRQKRKAGSVVNPS
ncbi:AAA family ATPase [Mycobacterium sp. NPDC048908]|uniref:AAA family ATPase n=1 Tax=Mycobacterium sp. NPDC048908 TaxID=3364292 RepID=UPI0037126858